MTQINHYLFNVGNDCRYYTVELYNKTITLDNNISIVHFNNQSCFFLGQIPFLTQPLYFQGTWDPDWQQHKGSCVRIHIRFCLAFLCDSPILKKVYIPISRILKNRLWVRWIWSIFLKKKKQKFCSIAIYVDRIHK